MQPNITELRELMEDQDHQIINMYDYRNSSILTGVHPFFHTYILVKVWADIIYLIVIFDLQQLRIRLWRVVHFV